MLLYENVLLSKALRKTEISEFFIFSSFGIVFGYQSLVIFKKNPGFPNLQKFRKKSLEISSGQKTLFLGQKNLFMQGLTSKHSIFSNKVDLR